MLFRCWFYAFNSACLLRLEQRNVLQLFYSQLYGGNKQIHKTYALHYPFQTITLHYCIPHMI